MQNKNEIFDILKNTTDKLSSLDLNGELVKVVCFLD